MKDFVILNGFIEIKNKYFRDYRKKNPQKSKEAQQRYWQRKAEQELNNNK